jgi:hypothetical protein
MGGSRPYGIGDLPLFPRPSIPTETYFLYRLPVISAQASNGIPWVESVPVTEASAQPHKA